MTQRDQLPLPFPHEPTFAQADFLEAPSNEAALTWLGQTADWPDQRLALWGEPGVGKTHLLRLWAERSGASLLTGATLRDLPLPSHSGGIAIDDADTIPDEIALLHLLNLTREAGLPTLLAGRSPPARWPVRLPDLASRLRSITAVEIGRLEDQFLRELLSRLLADRQLGAAQSLQDWLLRRLGRSPAALREAVARLDRAGLAAGRPITRPLAAAVLSEMAGIGPDEGARPSPPGPLLL